MASKDQTPEIFNLILDGQPEPSEFADTILKSQTPDAQDANSDTGNVSPVESAFSTPGVDAHGMSTGAVTNPPIENDDVFNPDIHVAGPDGKGVKTSKGKFRRKPGRKTGKVYPGGLNAPQAVQAEAIDPVRMERAKADAQIFTALTFTAGTVLLGEEGKPIIDLQLGVNEPEEFVQAYTQYFYLSGPANIPPVAILMFTMCNYTIRRYQMPQSRSKFHAVAGWFKSLVGKVFKRKE